MLGELPTVIFLSLVEMGPNRTYRHVGIKNRQSPADFGNVVHEMEDVGSVQVIEDPQTQDHIEQAVLRHAEVPHIVLDQFEILQGKDLLHKTRLLDITLPAFN